MRGLVAFLMLATVLSGCADSGDGESNGTDGTDTGASLWSSPIVLEHDHGDPSSHDLANNMSLVGFHPLGDEGPPGSISEIDIAGGYAFLGVMGYGFQVVDINDPTDPVLVASIEVESTDQATAGVPLAGDVYLADLKVDDKGDWVFVALELSTNPGVLIYDARDKNDIKLAGFWPEPGLLLGCHMVEYARIGDNEYLFCAPLDNAVYVGLLMDPVNGVREVVQVARWMPTTEKFVQQQGNAAQTYLANGDYVGAALHFVSGHQDMTYQNDPLTGAHMLSVSFWNLGLRFVDVSNPLMPTEIGSWAGEDSETWDGVLHTSMMFESNGRRIAVTTPEGSRPPSMFVLDATDLDNPVILAEWMSVPDFLGEDSRFSLHNFQIVDGILYLAHYHGGLWVLDLRTPEMQMEPYALGTYLPWDRETGRGCCGGSWDVVVYEGYVLSANRGGLYVAQVDGLPVGNEGLSSFA